MESETGKPIDIADPFARKLMARYLKRREAEIGELKLALEATEFEKIRVTGHKLFGSGATYGLNEISRLGQGIEKAAEARDVGRIRRLIGELQRFLKDLKIR